MLLSSIIFIYLVVFCILGNRAVPFSLSFFWNLLEFMGGFYFIFFNFRFLFFFSFYASFYLLVRGLMGKKITFYRNLNLLYFYFFVLISYFFYFFIFSFNIYFKENIVIGILRFNVEVFIIKSIIYLQ